MVDPYTASSVVKDFQKKFLAEKISKIKSTANKGDYDKAFKYIRNLTTPWEITGRHGIEHQFIQRKLWDEVQQLWVMTSPEDAPRLQQNPYTYEEETIKKRAASKRRSRCGTTKKNRCGTKKKKSRKGRR